LIKDLAQNVNFFHPRVFEEGSQKLIIGTLNNADFSSFKQTFEKCLQVLKEMSNLAHESNLEGRKSSKKYKKRMFNSGFQFCSDFCDEVLNYIRDMYLISLPFRRPIVFEPSFNDFFDMGNVILTIGSPSEGNQKVQFKSALEKRWAYLKERDSKIPDNGFLIGKNARMQRW